MLAASARGESERRRVLPGRSCVARSGGGTSASSASEDDDESPDLLASRRALEASDARVSARPSVVTDVRGDTRSSQPGAVRRPQISGASEKHATQSASRLEMARTRQLVAPKGTGALLSCALSPHDGGATLAVGGENAAALVFDLRGAHLVAHRLTAAAGCFDRADAVPCVSYNLAAPHALYCASGRTVTAWDVRQLPVAANARVVDGSDETAKRASSPTRRSPLPADEGTATRDADDADDAAARASRAASRRGALDVYAHNADEINHFAIDRDGACLYAADDACEVTAVDLGDARRQPSGGRLVRTLRRDGHESFVSCVALRAHKPREVVSGGLDARVCVWDRGKAAAVRRWNVPELIAAFDGASAETTATATVSTVSPAMNPPFVHCVAVWESARDPARRDALRRAATARWRSSIWTPTRNGGRSRGGPRRKHRSARKSATGRARRTPLPSAAPSPPSSSGAAPRPEAKRTRTRRRTSRFPGGGTASSWFPGGTTARSKPGDGATRARRVFLTRASPPLEKRKASRTGRR